MTKFTAELDERAYHLVKSGQSQRSLIRGLGVSRAALPGMVSRHERRMRGEVVPPFEKPIKWTDVEDRFLRENRSLKVSEISQKLGRPESGIRSRLHILSIRKFPKPVEPLLGKEGNATLRRMKANIYHLIDLKKAGYSPTMTGDRPYTPVCHPIVYGALSPGQDHSRTGSCAAMCEGS
jgi:hypothetical protein